MVHRTTETDWQSLYEAETRISAKQAAEIVQLRSQVTNLKAFAESFHVTVCDNFYNDVSLTLERPHSLSIRLRNDSSKSWIFADLEARRREALSQSSAKGHP